MFSLENGGSCLIDISEVIGKNLIDFNGDGSGARLAL